MSSRERPSTDLPPALLTLLVLGVVASLVVLAFETRRHPRRHRLVASGMLAALSTGVALLRPRVARDAHNQERAPLAVLLDDSRSLALPFDDRVRARDDAVAAIRNLASGYPIRWFALGGQGGQPVDITAAGVLSATRIGTNHSAALADLVAHSDTAPRSIVVVSDGRDTSQLPSTESAGDIHGVGLEGVPIHAVALGRGGPDASIADLRVVGPAFAHGPITVRVEVLCHGLACGGARVRLAPLSGADGPVPVDALLDASSGRASADLSLVFEHPGRHAIEARLEHLSGDILDANDARTLLLDVRRERVRMLHVAGRPTNDVRALRRFLKANPSIDLISFFILRTPDDDPRAPPAELSLIPFPVDELFEEHLTSFDAVVVQDLDAEEYGLSRHLRRLARYVEGGGGLVLVGGPHAFAAGGYDRSSLAPVLPTMLEGGHPELASPFVPRASSLATEHPVTRALARGAIPLPELDGTSPLGTPVAGTSVLWEHPSAQTRAAVPMPVLAAREVRSGRVVTMASAGTWRLGFSPAAAEGNGGAYDILWDAIVGWTLHDARFDPPPLVASEECTPGAPLRLALPVDGLDSLARATGAGTREPLAYSVEQDAIVAAPLPEGVHELIASRRGRVTAAGPIWCGHGSLEWVDVRPDPARLKQIAADSGGTFFSTPRDLDARILPRSRVPTSSRHERPLVAAWILTLLAAASLGVHWYDRRRFGLR